MANKLDKSGNFTTNIGQFVQYGGEVNMKKEFKNQLLHKNCKIDEKSMQISNGIETMVDSLKNAILQQNIELLKIPILLDFNN